MKKNRLLSGLSRDYTTAFVLNLDTDEYEFVFNQATNHAQKREEFRKFSDYVDAYASAFALPEFQDVMRRELDSNVIKNILKQKTNIISLLRRHPTQQVCPAFRHIL
mgnify:CR=1 FL=1